MEKKLQSVGNSLALVIDKSLRDVLGISKRTKLHLWTDGRRLIVEPRGVEAEAPAASVETKSIALDAHRTMLVLVRRYDMSQNAFTRLHHGGVRFGAYLGWAEFVRAEEIDERELQTLRRFQACLGHLREGRTWDEAIERARAEFPLG